ncbi:hypothetical protein C8Q79DRAFT_641398 [Trametes meyenii]|nr:hypothetical protein C8Q79DRAFT_641398 [Trametes meyenii]
MPTRLIKSPDGVPARVRLQQPYTHTHHGSPSSSPPSQTSALCVPRPIVPFGLLMSHSRFCLCLRRTPPPPNHSAGSLRVLTPHPAASRHPQTDSVLIPSEVDGARRRPRRRVRTRRDGPSTDPSPSLESPGRSPVLPPPPCHTLVRTLTQMYFFSFLVIPSGQSGRPALCAHRLRAYRSDPQPESLSIPPFRARRWRSSVTPPSG